MDSRCVYGREDVVLFQVSSKTEIEDKAVLSVEYLLTHVLEPLPAVVSQVQIA